MEKKILGLDLGTNSIGWSIIQHNSNEKTGEILGLGSRILPMSQDILGKFDSGQSISQTAERTRYRGIRRLYQRDNLRRERLHRVLHILDFLPKHYADTIDFEKKRGQFKEGIEDKINYCKNAEGKYEFLFRDSFLEMVNDFKNANQDFKVPYDWTLYYLRKKALTKKISKEELAWVILNFNQKRGYYQLRGEEQETNNSKIEEYYELKVKEVEATEDKNAKGTWYNVILENDWIYRRQSKESLDAWKGKYKEFIITTSLEVDGHPKLDKEGNIKMSFRAVDSEKDWIAIKSKTEQDIEKSNKTVGEYIYEALLQNPKQKIRGRLVKTIERKFYKDEFRKIMAKQIELQPQLFSDKLYKACIEELYPRNEAHQNNIKDKGFQYLLTDDIIFYQRPLKSKKSTISDCQFETRSFQKVNEETGKIETISQSIKAISKSHPLFQEFRLWQWIQNLKILDTTLTDNGKDKDITAALLINEDDWTDLYDFLSLRSEVEQKHIIDYFVKKKRLEKSEKDIYRWNYVYDDEKKESRKYPCCETKAQFISRLKKVANLDAETFLSKEKELHLWHLIYSVTDKKEFETALTSFANKHQIDEESFVDSFKKFPPFKSDYGSYSEKAIKKLLPLMRIGKYWNEEHIHPETQKRIDKIITGEYDEKLRDRVRDKAINLKDTSDFNGLPLWLASYIVYDRHSEAGDIQNWKKPEDIDLYLKKFKQHSLRNPIVEQVVTETLRVVRDIWQHFGKGREKFFEEIHIELGREMKNPAEKRKRMTQQNSENENTNIRIREVLRELMNDPKIQGDVRDYSPSHQELLKIYEEGIYQNPNKRFTVLSEDDLNAIRNKSNPSQSEITKYKLWLEQGYISPYTGQIIRLSELFTHHYQIEHIIPQSRYFDDSLSNKVICESDINQDKGNKTAYEYLRDKGGSVIEGHKLLTLEQYENHCNQYFNKNRFKLKNLLSEDIPEGFINRQMNDSRYISKLVKGLMSNLVREDDEQDAMSKNVIPVTGAITSKLKQDWGLNDKWNELIAPRFQRLNGMTESNNYGFFDKEINAFRIRIPDEISKGFSKKRIDHRHHALDALVIACCSRKHIQYLNSLSNEKTKHELQPSLLIKNKQGHYTKTFQLPWKNFSLDAKSELEKTIVSFKQNNRVINKTNNKTWQWVEKEGKYKKELVAQTKGDNWAIRKPMHKDTVSGILNMDTPKGKIATASRVALSEIKTEKHLDKITDISIQKILKNHLQNFLDKKGKAQYDLAFNDEGVEELNKNIQMLNNGKPHQPIKKVRLFEIGSKFQVGENGTKSTKYVEAAKGTNLFFAIYWDEEKQKRNFETIPLNEVITHQKQVASLPAHERTPIQPKLENGQFLFTLSPNDLVYVPTDEEMENSGMVDFGNLNNEQVKRVMVVNDFTGVTCYFAPNSLAKAIASKEIDTSFDSKTAKFEEKSIKEKCWKLNVDRLGNIQGYEKEDN